MTNLVCPIFGNVKPIRGHVLAPVEGTDEKSQITAVTDANGVATVTLKAKAGFKSVSGLAFAGRNISQWVK